MIGLLPATIVAIELQNLSFTYQSKLIGDRAVLYDITLRVGSGEVVALVGASGSGKTTLVQHFNGLLRPSSGTVSIDGQDLSDKRTDLHAIRREVGLVFQFPENQLFEETVYNDVAFGPRHLDLPESQISERVERALDAVGLDFNAFKDQSPFHLSGGEKRRVAIAGVLAMEPGILVLDEPTVGLDGQGSRCVETIIRQIHASGRTVIFVTHNMDLVARLAARVVVLDKGRCRFDGAKRKLFANPDLLKEAGLILPQVPRFMHRVKAQGFAVRTDLFTLEEAEQELKRVGSG